MIELSKEYYYRVAEMINHTDHIHVFALSVAEDIHSGHLFVDNEASPTCCFVKSESGKYLVAGDAGNKQFIDSIMHYLSDKRNHRVYFDLYFSTPAWLDILYSRLEGTVIRLERSSYVHPESMASEAPVSLDDGDALVETDRDCFAAICSNIDPSYNDLWESPEKFLKHGFGYCLLSEGRIASICNTYYRSSRYAEIDICTQDPFRNRGYALAACAAFIARSKRSGLLPIWDCDAGNEPSNRLAMKLGFEKQGTYEMLWWHENPKVIESYLKKYNYSL